MSADLIAAAPDGFYWLSGPNGEDECLVKLYTNPDSGERGFGFGIWDGAGFLPLSDLKADSRVRAALDAAPAPAPIAQPQPLTDEQIDAAFTRWNYSPDGALFHNLPRDRQLEIAFRDGMRAAAAGIGAQEQPR